MAIVKITKSRLGGSRFGSSQLNRSDTVSRTIEEFISIDLKRLQGGWGHFGERQWGRTGDYTIRGVVTTPGKNPVIKFTSSSGAILGSVRSDVEKTILRRLKFTRLGGDCKDCEIILNKLPSFPLMNYSFVQIKVGNSATGWYFGRVVDSPEPSDQNQDEYKYRVFGLSEELAEISGDSRTFSALTDIGEIIYEIATEIIGVETKIAINDTLINQATSVPIVSTFTLDQTKLKQVLDDFAKMANHDWGVDGDGSFFFLPKEESIKNTYFLGYRPIEANIKTNIKEVRNRIIGTRKELTGAGTPGWKIGSISIDVKSQKKYGTKEKMIQLPGNASNDDIKLLTDAVLLELKEPKKSGKIKIYNIDENDFIERGECKLILPYAKYDREYESFDDPTVSFTKTGGGDLLIEQEETNFIDGQSSMKLSWSNAIGDHVETTQELKAKINSIRLYINQSEADRVIKFGFGWNLWDEYTKEIAIPASAIGVWVPFIWDVSDLGITRINRVGFGIVGSGSGTAYLDRMFINVSEFRHETFDHFKQIYYFSEKERRMDLELGPDLTRLENYMAGLSRLAEESRTAGEIQ